MSLKIRHRTFTDTRTLEVNPADVVFTLLPAAAFAKARTFRYDEILCVLLSPENLLSLQVGAEVFSLPVEPCKEEHREVIEVLLARLGRATPPEYPSQPEPPASTDSCPNSRYEY